ncbi:hypothetical protein ILUMI_24417 [Ignelater luminosus]|uniref:Uncharacterized protein n=1 Tax=Ignelater luminosus TaxID=2038154 RepID=A0A8K0C745_IGNLU|nr:hypothetical protein ILUMI_24417 [Ignelater luminosus]
MVQNWAKEKIPDYIAKEDCPSASPVLNSLNYDLWGRVFAQSLTQVWKVQTVISEGMERSLQEKMRTAIETWRPRLKACVAAKEGYFEV